MEEGCQEGVQKEEGSEEGAVDEDSDEREIWSHIAQGVVACIKEKTSVHHGVRDP